MNFTFLTDFFDLLLAKIDAVLRWFGDLGKAVFVSLWNMIKDVFCLGIDVLTAVVKAALAGVVALAPENMLQTWQGYWNIVPAGMLEVLVAIGIVPCFGIISTAIAIRLALQLIPFVRLGS